MKYMTEESKNELIKDALNNLVMGKARMEDEIASFVRNKVAEFEERYGIKLSRLELLASKRNIMNETTSSIIASFLDIECNSKLDI